MSNSSLNAVHRLALLLCAAVVGFAVLFGVQSWRSARNEQLRELGTVLALVTHSVDAYLDQSEAQLRDLAAEVMDGPGLADLPRVQRLLARTARSNPQISAVHLIGLDGQFLATSRTDRLDGLPSVRGEPSFEALVRRLGHDPAIGAELSRPLRAQLVDGWLFSLRMPVLDAAGRPVALLSWVMPVEGIKAFSRGAPVLRKASIGLLRDDGFLISRHPVPEGVSPDEMYGLPRQGALRQHLVAMHFPASGFVEGPNMLGGGAYANVYQRLARHPVTVFVAEPLSEFRSAWWGRVEVPFLLVGALLGSGFVAWRYSVRLQRARDAEASIAAEALASREREQRFLIDHLMAGLVVHGPRGEVLQCNPRACELLGLSDGQMRGRELVDPGWRFVREDGSPLPVQEYPVSLALARGGTVDPFVLGAVVPGRDETRWLLVRADPERDGAGHLSRVVATFVDITEQRRAERRFRTLYESSLDGVLLGLPDGRILSANPAACEMFGRSEAELRLLGRGPLKDPNDPRSAELVAEREREGHARGELRLVRADGTPFEAEVSAVNYRDDQGVMLTSVMIRDISDRRRVEEAHAARAVAERANRTKSEFVARISHELRTPLNAILGFAEVMALDRQHPLDAAQSERLRLVQQAGSHLLALINDLLDLSRVESGLLRVELAPLDLVALARDAADEVLDSARRRGLRFAIEVPDQPMPRALGDPVRLRQVLLNLLSNAIKYNRPGGRVALRLSAADERVCVEVADDGPGLTQQQVAELFQPFNRLGRESGPVEGTGIGLVIARGLVDLMQGRIEVESSPGKGCRFVVCLGIAPAVATVSEPAGTPPQAALAGGSASPVDLRGRVLYVDDDEVNRLLMQAFCGLLPGVELLLAQDGPQGVVLARERRPDVLLVDLMMPGMDGLAFLHEVRSDPAIAATPCVAVSASAMPQEIDAAKRAGFDGYLTKPLSAGALVQALVGALHPSRSAASLGAD